MHVNVPFWKCFSFLLAITALIFCNVQLSAQVATKTGSIYGQVMDEQKAPLPGVTISLESEVIPSQSATTGSNGSFRFANLPPETYAVTFILSGYSQIRQEEIRVTVGGSVELSITLKPELSEQLTVIAESPVLDREKTGTTTTYTQEYMELVPNGRDPWALLILTPGVDTSRLDTGYQSAFQPNFVARGGSSHNNVWNYDGINQSDLGGTGNSATFYDFEAFEEIQITTGGNDASIQTGGVAINLVTKRAGNKWDGNASFYRSGVNLDYGFNAGGPILQNKLFFWGAYHVVSDDSQPELFVRESTTLKDYNAKFNFNWNSAHSSQFAYFRDSREILGRNFAGAEIAPEALVDQNADPFGSIWTAEHTWVPNDRLILTAHYGLVGTDFNWSARGGRGKPMIVLNAIGRWEDSSFFIDGKRSSHDVNIEGNYFKEGFLDGDHEFKFGFEYRTGSLDTLTGYSNGVVIFDYYQTTPGGPLTAGYISAQHNLHIRASTKDLSFHITDTFRKDRLTLNLGFRFDHQTGKNNPATVPSVLDFKEFVGPFDYPGGDAVINTNDFSPRLGSTYALTSDSKTILRANYARYYDAYYPQFLVHSNPTATYNGATFYYANQNGDRIITPDELTEGPIYYGGLNGPNFDLNAFLEKRVYDENLSNAWTNEFIVGVERELAKDLSVGATFNYRVNGNFLRVLPFGISTADYVPGGVFSQSTPLGDFTVPYFVLGSKHDGTAVLTNIKDYKQTYRGVDITISKQMSNNILLNGSLTIQRQIGHYNGGDSLAIHTEGGIGGVTYPYDPTNLPFLQDKPYAYGPFSEWSLKISGVYAFPWNISTGAFVRYQQGYPFILFGEIKDDTLRGFYRVRGHRFLVEPIGSRRHDNIFTVDFQVQKTFIFQKYGNLTALLTIFNLTNADTVTSRVSLINNSNGYNPNLNQVTGRLEPRSYRFGLRYAF